VTPTSLTRRDGTHLVHRGAPSWSARILTGLAAPEAQLGLDSLAQQNSDVVEFLVSL